MREWNRREDETPKAYSAFQMYINMPPEERSIRAVAEKRGSSSTTTEEQWSSKYSWVDRAIAYDEHMAEVQLVSKQTTLREYQADVLERETTETAMLSRLATRLAKQIMQDEESGERIDSMDVKRLSAVVDTIQRQRRRTAQLPTSFRSDLGDDLPEDEEVFIVSTGD